jgi:hypothetical protein
MSRALVLVFIASAFISPYILGWNGNWWKFIPSAVAIGTFFRFVAPTRYQELLGINLMPKQVLFGLAIGIATFVVSRALIESILLPLGDVPGSSSCPSCFEFGSCPGAYREIHAK